MTSPLRSQPRSISVIAVTAVKLQCAVQLRVYLCRVTLEAGLILVCTLPFVLIAALHSRTRHWRLLLFVASLVVLNVALVEIPRLDGFQRLHWSWQECILSHGLFCSSRSCPQSH